jgi:tetratricopeptide (TPR) repeat protein
MGFRFWRRIKIAPGVTLNLSKSGGSLSFGPRGAKFTVGPRGQRATVGLPGTGLFYTTTFGSKSTRGKAGGQDVHSPTVRPQDRLTMGFFKRLITPDDEEALVDGCRELALGNEDTAFEHFRNAAHLADGAFLAGFIALKRELYEQAIGYLGTARQNSESLGRYFTKYGISATMSLSITEQVSAHVGPNVHGILMALVEVYQREKRWKDALECLEQLRRLEPEDLMVRLSLAELLMDMDSRHMKVCQRVVELSEGLENKSEIHAALLLYKAKALSCLGLNEAAKDVLTTALRRKKDRTEELLRTLRYELALTYENLGDKSRARSELEKLYAEAPDFEDVAEKLGLQ